MLRYVGLILLFNAFLLNAQKVYLPDDAFRAYLNTFHPNTIEGDSLLVDIANQTTDAFFINGIDLGNNPGIEYFTSISTLYISDCKIKSCNFLTKIKSIKSLSITESIFDCDPDFTQLDSLKSINLSSCELHKIPNLPDLESLIINYNPISQLQNLPPTVKKLELINGKLTELDSLKSPHLTSLNLAGNTITSIDTALLFDLPLFYLNLEKNKLDFRTLLSVKNHLTSALIGNQQCITLEEKKMASVGEDFIIVPKEIELTEEFNSQLLLNNKVILTSDQLFFKIDSLQESDAGIYQVAIIRNHDQEKLCISNQLKLDIKNCIDSIDFSVKRANCKNKSRVKINPFSPEQYHYQLTSASGDVFESDSGVFVDLDDNAYQLTISNERCKYVHPEFLQVKWVKCPQFELTPNNDHDHDYISFAEGDKVIILNEAGKRLGRLKTPILWNGSIHDKLLPNGYYLADINNGDEFIEIKIAY